MKLIFFIALRYFISKKQNKYSTFTTILAITGITLGLITLIVSSNIMEGFKYNIKEQSVSGEIFDIYLHGEYASKTLITNLKKDSEITYIEQSEYIYVIAERENQTGMYHYFILKVLPEKELIKKLKLKKEDLNGIIANSKFKKGEFLLIQGYENKKATELQEVSYVHNLNNKIAYISKENLESESFIKELNPRTSIRLSNKYAFDPEEWLEFKKQEFPEINSYSINLWTDSFKDLIQAIKMEELILKIIVFMIILTSSFNIISTLIMIVHEKKVDICLLKTYGMNRIKITMIFLIIGFLIGLVSIIFGNILGYYISLYINEIIQVIENTLKIQLIPDLFKKFNEENLLRIHINETNIFIYSCIILIMSIFASILPARSAQKIDASEGLKDE